MTPDIPEPQPDSNHGNTIRPLEGEDGIPSVAQARSINVSRKGVIAVALFGLSLIAVSAISINRVLPSHKGNDDASRHLGDKPMTASGDPHRLDMALPPTQAASTGARLIPAIIRRLKRRPNLSGCGATSRRTRFPKTHRSSS